MIKILQPHCTIMSRKTMVLKIHDATNTLQTSWLLRSWTLLTMLLQPQIAGLPDCALTWESHVWVDQASLERCSAVLTWNESCADMKGNTFGVPHQAQGDCDDSRQWVNLS